MRTYIDRFVAGISRESHRRVRLVPGAGRPRRARTTFVAAREPRRARTLTTPANGPGRSLSACPSPDPRQP